jgi:hypothetical protein
MKVIDLKWLIMFNVMAPAINKKSSAYYKRSSIFTRKKSQMALNFLDNEIKDFFSRMKHSL